MRVIWEPEGTSLTLDFRDETDARRVQAAFRLKCGTEPELSQHGSRTTLCLRGIPLEHRTLAAVRALCDSVNVDPRRVGTHRGFHYEPGSG